MSFRLSKSLFIKLFVLAVILLQLPDLTGSSNLVQQKFIFTSNTILFSGILLAAFIRLIHKNPFFPDRVTKLFAVSSIFLILVSILFSFLDNVIHANLVYSYTRINYDQMGFLGAGFGLLWLLNMPNIFFSKYKKALIGFAPVVLGLFFVLMFSWPFDVLKRSLAEDGPVEWLQFISLLISAIVSLLISYKLFGKNKRLLAIGFAIAAFGFIFIAGEEISWGQRLLNVATPENLMVINRQGEISVHNITAIERYFFTFQLFISYYMTFAFILVPLLTKYFNKNTIRLFVPGFYYFFFFAPMVIFYAASLDRVIVFIPEIFELLLFSGIAVFLIENYLTNPYWNKNGRKQ